MELKILTRQDENNREYAYRVLRQNIMTFALEPGHYLNENDIAQMLGMSRTPVHEAVMKLRDEKLVDVIPQSASRVSLIDLALIREGYFLRTQVEPLVLQDLAGKVDLSHFAILQSILNEQQAVAETGKLVPEFYILDDRFHRYIYSLYSMPNVWDLIKGLSSHLDRVRYLHALDQSTSFAAPFMDQHLKIYEILMTGIPYGMNIEDFVEKHISTYQGYLLELMQTYPKYFLSA